jgi:hypothetical protein
VRISLRAGETFCAFAVSVELPSGTLKRSPQAMLTAYRRTAVLLLASIFCCWCHFGESRQRRNGRCNIQKFERKLATEMHDLFEDAFNKHGCNGYSDMHCSAQGGADGLECFLKKAVPLPEGPMCRPDLLKRSATREVSKFVNKANQRFGCGVKQVVCKMDLDGWTKCSTTGTPTDFDFENGESPSTCDMGILKVDVEHEINKELSKSRRKFGCPRIKKIVCDRVKKYGEKHINCRVSILENENIRNSCDMNLVTRELSEDVGESFLKSEFKYMCYVPRRMVCWVDKNDRSQCNLSPVEQDTAYDPGSPDIDDNGWKKPIDDDFSTPSQIHNPYENSATETAETTETTAQQPGGAQKVANEQAANAEGTFYEENEETNMSPAGKLRTFAAKYSLRGTGDGKKYFSGL